MSKSRPVFINPLKVRLPVTALVSITHRISGVVLILLSPLFLWIFSKIIGSDADFLVLKNALQSPIVIFIIWGGVTAVSYHLLAGLRHLIMDFGYCETLKAARFSAFVLIASTVILSVLIGMRLC